MDYPDCWSARKEFLRIQVFFACGVHQAAASRASSGVMEAEAQGRADIITVTNEGARGEGKHREQ